MKNKEKINKVIVLFISILLMATPVLATSGNANTPVQYTVNYILGIDTAFTVTPAGAETSMDFNPAATSSQNVEPDSQVKATNTPWAVITNNGNVAQNFSVNLTAAQSSYASVNISNSSVFTQQVLLSATAQIPTGWSNVASSGTANLYAIANFTNLPGGTTSKTLQINSAAS